MERDDLGYWRSVSDAQPGAKYFYRLDGDRERPDPASRFQPEGVHGPSEIVDVQGFRWTDAQWKAPALDETVLYELHVGTFTPEGTFGAVIPHLDRLAELGVTTIEIMPLAQFPGARNWGYDGACPYAVQNTYGGPVQLQNFVNAAHARGLAVALDVVYNHLGPEGNYLGEFGPYFTDHYRTPWGAALNFDGPESDEVRHFFVQNALGWLEHFHLDALRLDAIHGIFDASAFPFLAEVSAAVEALSVRLGRQIHLIAESDQNDARVLRSGEDGGFGMQGVWSDDFHHAVHTLVTGERFGYYADFGEIQHLTKTLKNGWCYAGQYSCYRRRKHGNSPPRTSASRFVVFNQNHDQVGNRAFGERLSQLISFEKLKLAAGITLLSPFTPLLFMGEEYGETAPFQYFTSHGDRELAEAVRRGRRADFKSFEWAEQVPDPQAESTFLASKLNQALAEDEPHRTLRRLYRTLLCFRREHRLSRTVSQSVVQFESARAVMLLLGNDHEPHSLTAIFHFGETPTPLQLSLPASAWEKRVDSADPDWLGPGASLPAKFDSPGTGQITVTSAPHSFAVFERIAKGSA
jgi:maltooligosyltrehalose trehalohydrolase